MRTITHVYKPKDGKMIRVILALDNGKISKVVFAGDFFIDPPEKIKELENTLNGKGIEEALHLIETLLGEKVNLIGCSIEDFKKALHEAYTKSRA
ncbi:hypothetical protein DRO02_05805 [archaeon]|nr:MAG: hypothetical protein DRO02_05805 [archaeon]RLG64159.1 MAG: hypothetical protein DRO21_04595 [archaeon]HDM23486.1 hypothetical protein [Candidatus Bathyarchaeota archaeon]